MQGRIEALWRYPVSSLQGERLEAATIDASGFAGDRLWGIVDAETGEIAAPEKKRRWRPATKVEARLAAAGAAAELSIARGPWLPHDGAEAKAALAAHFGFPAEVRPHPGSPVPQAATVAEPRYQRDALHLLTTASLAALQALIPGSLLDPRRFRANALVALEAEPGRFPESEWEGRELQLGTARFRVREACQRCAFTVLAADDYPKDPAVLAAIAQHNRNHLGVLCSVVEPGTVKLGDSFRLL